MVNIKKLRKRNKAFRSCGAYSKENSNYTERQQSDQVISGVVFSSRAAGTRAPGPGLMKSQATSKSQAASYKQVSSFRINLVN